MLGFWWLIAASIIAGILIIRILGEITKEKISNVISVQERIKGEGLYAKIKEVQPDTVKFGMYDMRGNHVQDVKMTSTFDYVSSRISVGDTIY